MNYMSVQFSGYCLDEDWANFKSIVVLLAEKLKVRGVKINKHTLCFGKDDEGDNWEFIHKEYIEGNGSISLELNHYPANEAKFMVSCVILYKYYNRNTIINIDERLASRLYTLP